MQIKPKFINRQEICGIVDTKSRKVDRNSCTSANKSLLSICARGGCLEKSSPIKGTESKILSDPPCKNGNARLTTVPLKFCLTN